MRLRLRNAQGEVVDDIDVRDDVFGVPMNKALVHQVLVAQLANARQGTAATKTRGRVSGGGAKPRAQKGTGRARQGTIRSPIWRGGGIVFGPVPRSYRQATPKRMRRRALLAVLSDKAREDQIVVLDELVMDEPKTGEMAKVLAALGVDASALLVLDGVDESVRRCARNIPRARLLPADLLNTRDLLNHRKIVMTLSAVRRAESVWGGALKRRKRRRDETAADQRR